jgi:hypothetical protein
MPRRKGHGSQVPKIGLVASLLALFAIGLVLLNGNYLPHSKALLLFAIAGVLALIHAVSYVANR